MQEIKIAKSFFYSAGDKYNWTKDGLDKRGVGISMEALRGNKELIVEVDNIKYFLVCKQAIAFIRKYGSWMEAGQRQLGIVSKSILEEVNK